MKDSFVFYRSFIEAGEDLDGDSFKRVVIAIGKYAMDGEEPELKGLESALFKSWRPLIDKANERYEKQRENGKKGGRPRKAKETQKNPKKPKETQNNPNETEENPTKATPNLNVNVNDNDNVNDNVNVNAKGKEKINKKEKPQRHKHGEYKHVLLSDRDMELLLEKHGQEMTDRLIKKLDEAIETRGYKYKNHYLVLNGWVLDSIKKDDAKNTKVVRNVFDEWRNA